MSVDQKLIDKIQKLLSLATSPNEHEARLAAEKANELLVRFNLRPEEISRPVEQYLSREVLTEKVMPYQALWILGVMNKHFFVKSVYLNSSRTRKTPARIWFVGQPTNVDAAAYVFSFLVHKFKQLWIAYRDESGAHHDHKGVYYQGLAAGLNDQLDQKRKQVEESMALMVVADPKLQQALAAHHPRTRSSSLRPIVEDEEILRDGYQEGKRLKIARGLSESGASQGLALADQRKK